MGSVCSHVHVAICISRCHASSFLLVHRYSKSHQHTDYRSKTTLSSAAKDGQLLVTCSTSLNSIVLFVICEVDERTRLAGEVAGMPMFRASKSLANVAAELPFIVANIQINVTKPATHPVARITRQDSPKLQILRRKSELLAHHDVHDPPGSSCSLPGVTSSHRHQPLLMPRAISHWTAHARPWASMRDWTRTLCAMIW